MAARVDTRAGLLQAARNLMLSSDSVDFSLSQIATDPVIPIYNYEDDFGDICTRLTVPQGEVS